MKIAKRFASAQSEMEHGQSSKSVTSSLTRLPTGTFSQLLPGAQDHETVSANLLRTLNTPEDDEEIKRNLRAGAVSELHRERTMRNIKEVCGVKNSGVQSDFHSMREKGMFFCGYQDVSMKKQGLPSVFAVEGEIQDVVSSDDETELMDTSRRAIQSPEEDRKIMLHRVKGTTVMRRTPEKHEAVFDFGESRISVPRELEDVAGQLQRIEVDLNDDGTGNIVLTTQPPRRTWMKTLPKALEEVVDVGQLQKNAKKEAKDQTHAVSRHVTRPPPSVKGWEAWREIQRQKRLNMEDAMRKMKSEGTEEVAEGGTSPLASPKGDRDEKGKAVRTAERKDKDSIPVAEKMQPPWDAAQPPGVDEINQALGELGVDSEFLGVFMDGFLR